MSKELLQQAAEALTAVKHDKSFGCLKEERTQAVVSKALASLEAAGSKTPMAREADTAKVIPLKNFLPAAAAPANCMDCTNHQVVPDRDPNDSFCDDDVAVLCMLSPRTPNANSEYMADRAAFQPVTVACRPYSTRKECDRPAWCPLVKQQEEANAAPATISRDHHVQLLRRMDAALEQALRAAVDLPVEHVMDHNIRKLRAEVRERIAILRRQPASGEVEP